MIVENKGTLKPDLHWVQNVEARDILSGAMQLNLQTKYKKRILIDIFYVNKKNEIQSLFTFFYNLIGAKKNIEAKSRNGFYFSPRTICRRYIQFIAQ